VSRTILADRAEIDSEGSSYDEEDRVERFRAIFSDLPDPRDINALHDLTEILFIALLATLAGASGCAAIAEFGVAKEALLREILELEYGIPSHDTFSRVFRMLDPAAFEQVFIRFMREFGEAAGIPAASGVVAFDGKSLRRAYEKGRAHMPPLMVTAWATGIRMVLAQTQAPNGNEVKATLDLLKLLDLKGCIVTTDALHCHRQMAKDVRAAGADYALKVKDNQPVLVAAAEAALAAAGARAKHAETNDEGHGRIERRRAVVVAAKDLAKKHKFEGLSAVGRIESWRTVNGRTSTFVHLILLSKVMPPAELLETVREHWSIENRQHWPLDVTFREDDSRARKDNAPRNLAVLRRLSMNILRAHPAKSSMNLKRQHAGWNDRFLLELFTHVR
jgi:predicted transposase YbfD/YdcC